ncbi:MAG: 50S ribosomal protein L23 [Candidatus Neomarinimicrobiota bacterium]|nr:50S ribosomal protein L23 [Candidatus Neomarinimicrobiota bacterium]
MNDFSEILIRPIVTEKMTLLQEEGNKYAFEVPLHVNKIEVKKAVEEKFKVKVLKVAITNRKGKAKQMTVKSGGRTIRTNGYTKLKKRAIVTLMEGYNIDLFSV